MDVRVSDYVCDGEMYDGSVRKHNRMLLKPKLRGVNLGGWLVLQPWITPSMFYQFENRPPDETAMDMLNYCRVLGPAEGNRQLREHWQKWVTEHDLRQLAVQGVNTVRVPVGDWMWEPYGPYMGCTNGSITELQRVLKACEKLGLRVLIDLHGARAAACPCARWGHRASQSLLLRCACAAPTPASSTSRPPTLSLTTTRTAATPVTPTLLLPSLPHDRRSAARPVTRPLMLARACACVALRPPQACAALRTALTTRGTPRTSRGKTARYLRTGRSAQRAGRARLIPQR